MTVITLEELGAIRTQSTNLFRLETLPQYLVPQDEARRAAWREGNPIVRTPETSPWLKTIQDTTAAGAYWWRVHILDCPLVEYSKFELHGYQANAAAGEHIYLADRAWHAELADLHEDFWLYDQKIVVRMIYDKEGHFLRPDLVDDPTPYLAIRDTAFRHAIPLFDYLHKYEPDLIA